VIAAVLGQIAPDGVVHGTSKSQAMESLENRQVNHSRQEGHLSLTTKAQGFKRLP
jgi:hypothetical protein